MRTRMYYMISYTSIACYCVSENTSHSDVACYCASESNKHIFRIRLTSEHDPQRQTSALYRRGARGSHRRYAEATSATLPPGARPPRPPWGGAPRCPPEPRPAPLGAVRSRGSTYPITLVILLKVKGALEVAENGLRCEIDLNPQLGFNRT